MLSLASIEHAQSNKGKKIFDPIKLMVTINWLHVEINLFRC